MNVSEAIQTALAATGRSLNEVCYCHFRDLNDFDQMSRIDSAPQMVAHARKMRELGENWHVGFRHSDQLPHQTGMTSYLVLKDGSVIKYPPA